jgi:hypothetical protein
MGEAMGQLQTFKTNQYRAASITLRRNNSGALIDRDRMRQYGARNE